MKTWGAVHSVSMVAELLTVNSTVVKFFIFFLSVNTPICVLDNCYSVLSKTSLVAFMLN